jgi:hypothetical protein
MTAMKLRVLMHLNLAAMALPLGLTAAAAKGFWSLSDGIGR